MTQKAQRSAASRPGSVIAVPGTAAGGNGKSSFEDDLLVAMLAFRDGDFSARMPSSLIGVEGKIADAFKGKLCTGEPGVVPVGIYAKQSLEQLGWWSQLNGRIVGTDDVRTALAFVERGECPLGIVYATDAAISNKVEVLERFPDATHKPIVYPFALVSGARPEAKALMSYMSASAEAAAIFKQYGFVLLKP